MRRGRRAVSRSRFEDGEPAHDLRLFEQLSRSTEEIAGAFVGRAGRLRAPDADENRIPPAIVAAPFKSAYLTLYLGQELGEDDRRRPEPQPRLVMARTSELPDGEYGRLVNELQRLGYDFTGLREVPQRRRPILTPYRLITQE